MNNNNRIKTQMTIGIDKNDNNKKGLFEPYSEKYRLLEFHKNIQLTRHVIRTADGTRQEKNYNNSRRI